MKFNFIQQKSPTSVSGEMNAYWYFIQWGFKPRLNKVKASGGCHRFSEEAYRAELDKIWAQIRQSAFDFRGMLIIKVRAWYYKRRKRRDWVGCIAISLK
ncbi:hypothetical protein [Siminovitchia terrae]|uniref:hypothetical protein n=1 Tax=Siminovitchia terrae TaxID=1914933 RepID=UPI0028A89611|nr:hypothetical protein [Siminovitchia terrae]